MPNLSTFLHEVGAKGYQKTNWFEFRLGQFPNVLLPHVSYEPGAATFTTMTSGFEKWIAAGLVCTSVTLPGRSFSTTQQTIYGFERLTPTNSMYTPLSCTFLTPIGPEGNNQTLEFFQRWQNSIQDTGQTTRESDAATLGAGAFDMEFPSHIFGEAEVVQYSFIDLVENNSKFQLNASVDLGSFGKYSVDDVLGKLKGRSDDGDTPEPGGTRRQISLRHRYAELYPVTVGETRLDWGASSEFTQLDVTFNYSYWVDMGTTSEGLDNVLRDREEGGKKSLEDRIRDKAKSLAIGYAVKNSWI